MIKALAEGNRLRAVLALHEHGELCVCQITELLGLATATVSRHLSILQRSNLITSRKEGRWVYCALSEKFPVQLLAWLKDALSDSRETTEDRERLKTIMSCDLHDLCRKQKRRKSRTGQDRNENSEKRG